MFGKKKEKKPRPKAKAWAYIGWGGSSSAKQIVDWQYRGDGVTILKCTNGTTIELNPATACMIEYVKKDEQEGEI